MAIEIKKTLKFKTVKNFIAQKAAFIETFFAQPNAELYLKISSPYLYEALCCERHIVHNLNIYLNVTCGTRTFAQLNDIIAFDRERLGKKYCEAYDRIIADLNCICEPTG